MLPNTLGPVIVTLTFGIPIAIFAEAVLGFLGFSLPPPTASLGTLVNSGLDYFRHESLGADGAVDRNRRSDAQLHVRRRRPP